MNIRTVKKLLCGLFAAGALSMAVTPACAQLDIQLTNIGGVDPGSPQAIGFEVAAKYWESVLSGGTLNGGVATVYIDVGFSSLGSGILGSTSSTDLYTTVADLQTLTVLNGNSALDATVAANLPDLNASGGLEVVLPGYQNTTTQRGINTATSRTIDNSSNIGKYLNLTSANARALYGDAEIDAVLGGTADASITFSSNFAFDFDPTDGIDAGSYDFIGVAIHEIGHALGFTSGVDTLDYYGNASGPGKATGNTLQINNYVVGNLLDMYRYSADDTLNWRPGQASYFSIDGGATELFGDSNFSTGAYNGDGSQASHWKASGTCTDFIGAMNPYLCNGDETVVTASDLAVFDTLGWNVSFDVLANSDYTYSSSQAYYAFAGVPEPTTWLMLILGFGFVGGTMRSRGARKSVAMA